MVEDDGDDLLDCYISDGEDESAYWARRLGRRLYPSPLLVSPASCLLPDNDWETEVFWFRPDLGQTEATSLHLLQLASRVLTFFKAWRLRRDGGCQERRATAENLEKCLGGEETVTGIERNTQRLHTTISLKLQRQLTAIFPTGLPPEVLQRISLEVLKEEHEACLAFSPEQRREVGGCYQALTLLFTSSKSQFFINSEVARERVLSENENYYHSLRARLSPSIEKFQASVDDLENILNVF